MAVQQNTNAASERPVPLETLNKMIETLSKIPGSEWTRIDATPAYKDQTTDDRKFLKERAAELGIRPAQLKTIAHYLSLDPTSKDPEVIEARKKEFNKVIGVLKNHVPEAREGQSAMDKKVLETWQTTTAQAKDALESLEAEWTAMQKAKQDFEGAYQKTCESLEATKAKLDEYQEIVAQNNRLKDELTEKAKTGGAALSDKELGQLRRATSSLELFDKLYQDTLQQYARIEQKANTQKQELDQQEQLLAKKKFEYTTAVLVAALPEKEERITGPRLAVLDSAIQDTKELTEEVQQQTNKYRVAIRDYAEYKQDIDQQRAAMGRLKGWFHDNLQALGDKIFGTSDFTRYQHENATVMKNSLDNLYSQLFQEAYKLETYGSKTSNVTIEDETRSAMQALAKVNSLEKQIQKEQARLQEHGMTTRDMRRHNAQLQTLEVQIRQELRKTDPGRKYTTEEIRETTQYKEAAAKLTSAKLEKLQAARAQQMEAFKQHYTNAREGMKIREQRHQEFAQALKDLEQQIGDMREAGELSQGRQFDTRFADDLNMLLASQASTQTLAQIHSAEGIQLEDVREFLSAEDPQLAEQLYKEDNEPSIEEESLDDESRVEDPEEEEELTFEGR